MYFRRNCIAAFAVLSIAVSCGKRTDAGPRPRYAVLRFENLSGNAADDWMGRAASEVLSRTLAGAMDGAVLPAMAIGRMGPTLGLHPSGAPGSSTERTAAILSGANRLISGYFDRVGGSVRVTANDEVTDTGTSQRVLSATGATALEALSKLSRQFSPQATTYYTNKDDALRLYSSAVEIPTAAAIPKLEQSVSLEPNLGPAWVSLVGAYLSVGKRSEAEHALAQAKSAKLDPSDRANLDLEAANLQNDRKLHLAAMRKVAQYNPGDVVLLRSLATQETASASYREAAAIWKNIAEANPADVEAWNNLAYAWAYAGDSAAALAAAQKYVDLRQNEANPLDSRGDIKYLFRKFKDAAADYTAAAAKQPDALNGGELYKAAWALFKAGDLSGADATFAQFRADQVKRKNASLPLLESDWYYRTGRKSQGEQELAKDLASTDAPLKSILAAQLSVWQTLAGKRDQAAKTITSVPLVRNPAVISAFFVARPSASVPAWKALSEKIFPGPSMGTFRDTALTYALVLDGKRAAAEPIWAKVVEQGNNVDFFGRALLAKLQGKPAGPPILPNPLQYNEFAALLD